MVTLLPESVPFILALVLVLLWFVTAVFALISFFLNMQIPNFMAQAKAKFFRRGLVMLHYANNRSKFFAPKRKGKKGQENTLNLPAELGAKFDPSGSGLSEVIDSVTLYHYYSKLPSVLKPVYAKAVQDFHTICANRGISVNEELIDVLVVRDLNIKDAYTEPLLEMVMKNLPLPIRTEQEEWLNEDMLEIEKLKNQKSLELLERVDVSKLTKKDLKELDNEISVCKSNIEFINGKFNELNELKETKKEIQAVENDINLLKEERSKLIDNVDIITGYLNPETRERIETLTKLQKELKTSVIKDGLFVFSKIQELAFSVNSLTSSGVTESINIANSDALEQSRDENKGMTMTTLTGLVFLAIILISGIGVGLKIAFG